MILSPIVSPGNMEQVLMLQHTDRSELTSLRERVVRILQEWSFILTCVPEHFPCRNAWLTDNM